MKLYWWIAIHRVHSSPSYIKEFCWSAYLYFGYWWKSSCGCVGGKQMSTCVYTCTCKYVRQSRESCQGCKLHTNHYARQKLVYTCLDVDIHYGVRWEEIWPAASHDGNSDTSWQCHLKCLRYVHVRDMYTLYAYTKWTTKWTCNAWHSYLLLAIICEQLCNFADFGSNPGQMPQIMPILWHCYLILHLCTDVQLNYSSVKSNWWTLST